MDSVFDGILRFNYSRDLHDHLKGLSLDGDTYSGTSIYQLAMWFTIITSVIIMVNYYKGAFNRPRFTGRIIWAIHLLAIAVLVFLFTFFRAKLDADSKNYFSDLVITTNDCLLFGFTAAVYALVFCFALSLILKYSSLNHRRIPF